MNKNDLILKVSKDTGFSQKDVNSILSSVISNIEKSVKKGDTVSIQKFATFNRKLRKAKVGRNPRTGEKIDIPAKKIVTCKLSKNFRSV